MAIGACSRLGEEREAGDELERRTCTLAVGSPWMDSLARGTRSHRRRHHPEPPPTERSEIQASLRRLEQERAHPVAHGAGVAYEDGSGSGLGDVRHSWFMEP
uniref:Uncharacterized protein n=1 Tax=Arundo donax TaxID=35708 RepID=A0A0A8XVZ1_ARUDO